MDMKMQTTMRLEVSGTGARLRVCDARFGLQAVRFRATSSDSHPSVCCNRKMIHFADVLWLPCC